MNPANFINYLNPVLDEMAKRRFDNNTINIACHGHSVPAGYFAAPQVSQLVKMQRNGSYVLLF